MWSGCKQNSGPFDLGNVQHSTQFCCEKMFASELVFGGCGPNFGRYTCLKGTSILEFKPITTKQECCTESQITMFFTSLLVSYQILEFNFGYRTKLKRTKWFITSRYCLRVYSVEASLAEQTFTNRL